MTSYRRAGFTLLEVLVATLIMGLAVTALLVGLSQAAHNADRLAVYDRFVMLARRQMNELLLRSNIPFAGQVQGAFSGTDTGGVGGGWSATIRPYEQPPNAAPGVFVLQEIALDVWWQPASGGRRDLVLHSYRHWSLPGQ